MNDIQNRADYSADGFGISASVSNSNHGVKDAPKELGTSKTIGYGSDSDHQATTTKSGIITSDKESEYAGKLANNFDKNEVQSEIDTSVRVSQSFDATRQSVKQEINKEIDEANKVIKDETGTYSPQEKDKANEKIADMQKVGLIVDMVNGALYNPSDTLAGTAVNTLSPKIVYEIGQHFKENEKLNERDKGDRDEQGSTRHLLAQALVAGVTAGLAGNDILSSTISGGGGEAIAPYLAEYIYGVNPKDVSKMTAEQKQTISAIISLAGTAIGATSGSVTDMVASGEAGRVAVEENRLLHQAEINFISKISTQYASFHKSTKMTKKQAEEILLIAGKYFNDEDDYEKIKASGKYKEEDLKSAIDFLRNNAKKTKEYFITDSKMQKLFYSTDEQFEDPKAPYTLGKANGTTEVGAIFGRNPIKLTKDLVGEIVDLSQRAEDNFNEKDIYYTPNTIGKKGARVKDLNQQLLPNEVYILNNGHKYFTDSSGKVNKVEGTLLAIKEDRNKYQQGKVGKSGNTGDQGGHLIASALGGTGDKINLVPMNGLLNNSEWKKMENSLKKEVEAGKSVSVKIDVGYPSGGGVRPSSFTVNYTIDGGKPIKERFKQ